MIDFEKIKRNFKLQDLRSYDRMLIEKKLDQIKESARADIDNELKESLYAKWSLNFFKPYNYPINDISRYYGQKIALFYKFKSFFIKRLFLMSIVTVIF